MSEASAAAAIELIDFDKMSFDEKRSFVITCILKATNFNDLSLETLDWSVPSREIHVSSNIVWRFVTFLDCNKICSELAGKKSIEEILKIVLIIFRKKWYMVYKFLKNLRVENMFALKISSICAITLAVT